MSIISEFHQDTDRTFPESTEEHKKLIMNGLYCDADRKNMLLRNLKNIMHTGVASDCIKSFIFYSKYKGFPEELDELIKDIPEHGEWAIANTSVQLIHGLIGIASENAELAKAIILGMTNRENFDVVNIKEEVGDILVYLAVIGNALGFTLEEAMEANIAKREKRFPHGFSKENAVNRNLEAERSVLEGKET